MTRSCSRVQIVEPPDGGGGAPQPLVCVPPRFRNQEKSVTFKKSQSLFQKSPVTFGKLKQIMEQNVSQLKQIMEQNVSHIPVKKKSVKKSGKIKVRF